jgi:hypothetical protein
MKPIRKAICAGVVGALIAFGVASLACANGSSIREHDGMVLIVCGPNVEDIRPWYWAFAGYALAFTPVLLFASGRVRSDAFRL